MIPAQIEIETKKQRLKRKQRYFCLAQLVFFPHILAGFLSISSAWKKEDNISGYKSTPNTPLYLSSSTSA